MSRVIFHVDVNSAFLSWSAAYRVRVLGEQEDLRDIPSAVAGESAQSGTASSWPRASRRKNAA